MSAFERYAVERILEKARTLGVPIPPELSNPDALFHDAGTYAAREWLRLHPEQETEIRGCCWPELNKGPDHCLCWEPVFDVDQAQPRPPAGPQDLNTAPAKCHDCAWRKGSPEMADEYTREALIASAREGRPFWCHQGMRRPRLWRHPDGREVPGSPDDWQPAQVNGIPYQADGTPGILCAGWAIAARSTMPFQPAGQVDPVYEGGTGR